MFVESLPISLYLLLQLYLKKDCRSGVFLWILQNFTELLRVTYSVICKFFIIKVSLSSDMRESYFPLKLFMFHINLQIKGSWCKIMVWI